MPIFSVSYVLFSSGKASHSSLIYLAFDEWDEDVWERAPSINLTGDIKTAMKESAASFVNGHPVVIDGGATGA